MPKRRFGTFTGGIDLPEEKAATLNAPIVPIGRLRRLAVPLAPVHAPAAVPVVEAGQSVQRGQLIAEARPPGQVDVYAPLGGKVGGVTQVALPQAPLGWRRCPALELAAVDKPPDVEPLPVRYEWQAADGPSLHHRIREGGLLTAAASPQPLAEWVDAARAAGVDTLVANVMETTPFVTADHRLLAERGSEVVRGLVILARALGAAAVMLAVDRRHTGSYRAAVEPAELYGIDAMALAHKYPISAEAILVKVLTRRTVPAGGTPFDVGAAVTDAATCWATFRWVAGGQRQLARVVTLGGDRLRKRGNFLVPFGAEVSELLAWAQAQPERLAVYGPAMTGRALVHAAVVSAGANALLAQHLPASAPPTACIRCGWCVESCPARLNVAELNDDFELGRAGRALRRGVLACVDCGTCSYVCPARLPLAYRVALLKQTLTRRNRKTAHAGQDHAHAPC